MKSIAIIGQSGTNARLWTEAFLKAGWRVCNLVRAPEAVAPRPNLRAVAFDFTIAQPTSRRLPALTCWR
jgi:hypothetical protein